jgi:hypothetical protein
MIAGIASVAAAASGLTAAVLKRTNTRIELPRVGR